MRIIIFAVLGLLSISAFPAETPDPPPPAPAPAQTDEPQVTVIKRADQTIEEYRSGGRLYMIKVTPKVGRPYYLVDDRGDGKFARQESLDTGFRPPQWVFHFK
jgi:hypothetical protein